MEKTMKRKLPQLVGIFLLMTVLGLNSFQKNKAESSNQDNRTKSSRPSTGNGIKELGTYPGH